MYDKLLAFLYRLESSAIFSSIKQGFILIIPVVLTGSLALLLRNFPIPGVQGFLQTFMGGALNTILGFIFDATVGFMSAALVLSISYFYSAHFVKNDITLQILAMLTSLTCFTASFGAASGSLTLDDFGTIGVFTALVCAIIATRLFFVFGRFIFHKRRSYALGADVPYQNAMAAIAPMLLCVSIFALANYLLKTLLHVDNFNQLISSALVAMFSNIESELGNGLLFTFMLNLLWFFGIHGGNALDDVASAVFAPASTGPSVVISKSLLDNFAVIGGCGATLCLLLALLIASRFRSSRRLAYSATPLLLFNINEILVYGLPIVLNPVMLIPFITVPLIAMLITYVACNSGFMPLVVNHVTWTTPVFFSGYFATGSMRGVIIQLLIVLVGTGIYIPFVRFSEQLQHKRTSFLLHELVEQFWTAERRGEAVSFLNRHDNAGIIAKSLIGQLHADLDQENIVMYYQPQLNHNSKVVGAEALLRWQFNGQAVPPPVIIALAKEDGCFDKLSRCICRQVCKDIVQLRQSLPEYIRISVNITAEQLDDPHFVQEIIELTKNYAVNRQIILEVTEETSLIHMQQAGTHIELLRQNGILLAIDDFSMGQTSLDYLRTNSFNYVKLDGKLVRQVVENPRCRDIIASIITLGKSLQFKVIAEHVETAEIRNVLYSLGCSLYQGYLYAPALPPDDFSAYYQRIGQELAEA